MPQKRVSGKMFGFPAHPRNSYVWDLPGSPAVKKPPANARDMDSKPGLGRSHMPRSGWALAPQVPKPELWSLGTAAPEACLPAPRDPQQEKPLQWEVHARCQRVAPLCATRKEKRPNKNTKTQSSQKLNKIRIFKVMFTLYPSPLWVVEQYV